MLASGPASGVPRAETNQIASFSDLGGTLTGNLTYERFYDEPQGWRFLGAPFADVPFTTLSSEFQTQGATGATFPTGSPVLYTYDSAQPQDHRWVPVTNYTETAEPGRGYLFFAFRDRIGGGSPHLPGRWTVAGQEHTGSVSPSLHFDTDVPTAGFNFVANPFAGPLDWHAVQDAATGVGATYYVWDASLGAYRTYIHTGSGLGEGNAGRFIAPFQGYFVLAEEAGAALPMTTAMKAVDESPVVLPRPEPSEVVAALTLALEGQGLTATQPSVLFVDGDTGRYRAPWLAPVTSTHAALYFSDVSVSGSQRLVYTDADADAIASGEAVELDLHVRSSRTGAHTLSWPTWRDVPDGWQLTLVDRTTGETVDLRETQSYTFTLAASRPAGNDGGNDEHSELRPFEDTAEAGRSAARFGLVVGPQGVSSETTAPARFELASAFPNPFADQTTVRFAVPASGAVRLAVYDVMGREVARLVDGAVEAGAHEVVWRASGVASGVYLVRLTAGAETQTRRVTLVR